MTVLLKYLNCALFTCDFLLFYKYMEKFGISVLVGTAIKVLKQAAEMKHNLSACILIPTLARHTVQLK